MHENAIHRITESLCNTCKSACSKNGTVPSCWGQYGNPCDTFLEAFDKEYENCKKCKYGNDMHCREKSCEEGLYNGKN